MLSLTLSSSDTQVPLLLDYFSLTYTPKPVTAPVTKHISYYTNCSVFCFYRKTAKIRGNLKLRKKDQSQHQVNNNPDSSDFIYDKNIT